jgi:hypothetical protein
MTTRFSTVLAIAGTALLLAASSVARADDSANPPPDKQRGPEHMIQKFDKNGNHALEASEVPPRMWAHISVADANKDGSITLQELQDAIANGTLKWHHHGEGDGAKN